MDVGVRPQHCGPTGFRSAVPAVRLKVFLLSFLVSDGHRGPKGEREDERWEEDLSEPLKPLKIMI